MPDDLTAQWKRLFQKNCAHWDARDRGRYVNIPNDPEDIDAEELQACRELIEEINGKPPVE
jgi:hypothetical protein